MTTHLAEQHRHLAGWVVHQMTRRTGTSHHDIDDYVSTALLALVETANRYNPDSDATFITYALPRLRGAVLDAMRADDWAPRSIRDARHRLNRTHGRLCTDLGREPTDTELATAAGLTIGGLDQLRADIDRANRAHLEDVTGPDGGPFDAPERTPTPEEALLLAEERRHLHACVAALPVPHRDVVARNFFGGQTLTVIAADLGLTLPRVSQIRVRALVLLRAALVHVWEERQPETVGGVRARNEQARYVASAVEACRAAA